MKIAFSVFLLVFLSGALYGSYLFFHPIKIEQNTAASNPLNPKRLPLGDGKLSSVPKAGYIMSCQQRFGGFPGGAFRDGDWIKQDGTWDSTLKPTVDGDVAWNGKYEIKLEGNKRKLIGNGVPVNHHTGIFPIQRADDVFQYDRNPNSISETQIVFELPQMPQVATQASCVGMGTIGVMKSGVAIFNGLDAAGRDAAAHEIQDKCNGHPQQDGHYHYHNLSPCLEDQNSQQRLEPIGYALDGFGIFGRFGEDGQELTNADLDECHGHTSEILWDGKTVNMYHYHATLEYPYTIGCFKGTPVQDRNMRRPPGNRPPFPPRPF